MNDDLNESLRTLAEVGPQHAGPAVKQRLLVHFRERRYRRRRAYLAGAVTFLAMVVMLSLVLWHESVPQAVPSATLNQTSGFITLPYGESGVPLEQPVIVRVDIPVSQLGIMGMPPAPRGAKEKLKAELLIGQDGVARAVRFVE